MSFRIVATRALGCAAVTPSGKPRPPSSSTMAPPVMTDKTILEYKQYEVAAHKMPAEDDWCDPPRAPHASCADLRARLARPPPRGA